VVPKEEEALNSLTLLACGLIIASRCSGGSVLGSRRETARIASPDGVVEAVLSIDNGGGATVGTYYYVSIVPKGAAIDLGDQVAELREVHSAANGKPELRWRRDRDLTIHFQSASVSAFANKWSSNRVRNFAYTVEISLKHPDYDFVEKFPGE
jgi:hypothetical protein